MNVQEQISLFRNYANERPYANDTTESAVFWRTSAIIEYLNQAKTHYNAFLNDLDESYNIGILEIPVSEIVIATGILCPEDLQKIKLVTFVDPSTSSDQEKEIEIKPVNLTAKTRDNRYSSFGQGSSTQWYFQGNYIKFINWDNKTTSNVRIYYLKNIPDLKNLNDIPQLPEILHENMVIYGLIQGLLRDKQASLAGYWNKLLGEKDKFSTNHLKPRQVQEPNKVQPRDDWDESIVEAN